MLSRFGRTTTFNVKRLSRHASSPALPRLNVAVRRCTNDVTQKTLPPTSRAAVAHREVLPVFRGISQILWTENAAFGCFILGTVTAVKPAAGLALFVGSALSILWGRLFGTHPGLLQSGVIAFNGILVAMALPVFIPHDIYLPLAVVGGTFISTAFFDFGSRLLGPNLPLLSIPFVCTVLSTLFLIQGTIPFTAVPLPTGLHLQDPVDMLQTTLATSPLAFSQLFFVENLIAGSALVAATTAFNWKAGVSGVVGAAIGIFTGLVLGYDITAGLWGFNTALTAMALFPTFGAPFWVAISGSCLSAVLYPFALNLFGGFGLPALSTTFCIGTLTALFLRKLFSKK